MRVWWDDSRLRHTGAQYWKDKSCVTISNSNIDDGLLRNRFWKYGSVFWFHMKYIFDDGNRFANSGTKHPKSHTPYCYLSLLLWATWILPWQAACRTVKIPLHNIYTVKDKTVIKASPDIDNADPLKPCNFEPAQQLPAPHTVSIKRWKMGWMQ